MPGLSDSQNKKENLREMTDRRFHKSHRSAKKKKSLRHNLRRIYGWIKNNPLKTIAFFSIGIIIYLSVLFYAYDVDILNSSEDVLNSKISVKGLLLPKEILNENSQVLIQFGSLKSSLTGEKLRRGISISPMNLTNCEKVKKRRDPTKFFIFLEGDRLYVSTSFKELANDGIIGSINKKHLKVLSGDLSAFRSEDNFFEVLDGQENVVFNMEFTKPNLLVIQGYFISTDCIYVAVENKIYSDHKAENYIEKALPEIRQIKKLFNYDIVP